MWCGAARQTGRVMSDETSSRRATIQALEQVQIHLYQLGRSPLLAPVTSQLADTFTVLGRKLETVETGPALIDAVRAVAGGLEQLSVEIDAKPATALTYLTQLQQWLGGLPGNPVKDPPPPPAPVQIDDPGKTVEERDDDTSSEGQ